MPNPHALSAIVFPGGTSVLLYSLLPSVVMVAGAVIAVLRSPEPVLRNVILHFAAGVVFSVVAVELLPDIVRQHEPFWVVIGFSLGVAVMLGLRAFTRRLEENETRAKTTASAEGRARLPIGLLVAVGIDLSIDGLLLGIGFAAGAKEGMLLAIALTLELLSLGLATAVQLRELGFSKSRSVGVVAGLAISLLIGAAVGSTLLSGAAGKLLEIVLSFGLAALLFLVTEELLTEAHEQPESPWMTASFFVGFLLFLILGMVL
jgi:ZIP family zinc transporter